MGIAPYSPVASATALRSTPFAASPAKPGPSGLVRETYTAGGQELPDGQLGTLVRKEGQGPSGDKVVDDAHDNAGIVFDFYKTVLGRDSLYGPSMSLKSTAHYGNKVNNAWWDGTHMTYGDGDGKEFAPLSGGLDVVAHEMTHGVTERTAGLNYENQPGALNESWSDVMGELVQQWHANPTGFASVDGAKQATWLIGEDVFTPGTPGDALRSLKAPGTAYKGDPQPADMAHYKQLPNDQNGDYGGVHINSGIPNRAAYEAAVRIGGLKTAEIWYRTLTNYLRPDSQFSDAANYTVSAARDLFKDGPEVQAVRDAWKAVGITSHLVAARNAAHVIQVAAASGGGGVNDGVVPPWFQGAALPAAASGAARVQRAA